MTGTFRSIVQEWRERIQRLQDRLRQESSQDWLAEIQLKVLTYLESRYRHDPRYQRFSVNAEAELPPAATIPPAYVEAPLNQVRTHSREEIRELLESIHKAFLKSPLNRDDWP